VTHVDGVSGRAGRGWFFLRIRGRSDRVTTAGEQLDAQGVHIPLVADMHFNRKAAMIACEAYDKIRVNPGNFADGRKTFEEIDYDVARGVRCSTRGDGVRVGHVPDLRRRAGTSRRWRPRSSRRVGGVGCHPYAVAATQHTRSRLVASAATDRWRRGGRRRSESRASHGRYQHRTRSSSKMNEPTSRKRLRP